MKRAVLIVAALVAGLSIGEVCYRTDLARKFIARFASDEFVSREKLRRAARSEKVADEEIDREINLLREQFADEKVFTTARKSSGFTVESLRIFMRDHLGTRHWIEEQIAPSLGCSAAEVQNFYASNAPRFALGKRYRVNHIFVAAPDGYPDEVIAAKRGLIEDLSIRILAGEKFNDLVAEASEDEATKANGGDLGYFSAQRVPPEFVAEVEKLHLGEISGPIRSHLGFHILQLTEIKNPEVLSLEKVQSEIAAFLINEKRTAAVTRLRQSLASE